MKALDAFTWVKVAASLIGAVIIVVLIYKIYQMLQTGVSAASKAGDYVTNVFNSATDYFKTTTGEFVDTVNQVRIDNPVLRAATGAMPQGQTYFGNLYDISHGDATEEQVIATLEANPFTAIPGFALNAARETGLFLGNIYNQVITPAADDTNSTRNPQIGDIVAP